MDKSGHFPGYGQRHRFQARISVGIFRSSFNDSIILYQDVNPMDLLIQSKFPTKESALQAFLFNNSKLTHSIIQNSPIQNWLILSLNRYPDGHKVADAGCQHKHMPDSVVVG